LNKIKNFSLLAVLIFILFYSSTLIYSFTNIYLSFKQESSFQLQDFIDKKKLSLNFRKQLNTIIYEKIKKDAILKIIYSLDKKNFDMLISQNISKLSDYLSDEKIIMSLYKNPSLIRDQIDNLKLDKIQEWDNAELSVNPSTTLEKKKFKLVGPNIKELYKDTNYFFLTSLNTFKLDFIHKDINIIVKLNLDKIIWKISSVEIKF
jgi:hypothetical protein|tara:strand:- start:715 stop:1329 length:615 start_codon:yes stop_codon:yes gene_type:complete